MSRRPKLDGVFTTRINDYVWRLFSGGSGFLKLLPTRCFDPSGVGPPVGSRNRRLPSLALAQPPANGCYPSGLTACEAGGVQPIWLLSERYGTELSSRAEA